MSASAEQQFNLERDHQLRQLYSEDKALIMAYRMNTGLVAIAVHI
jgi:hypothetical protein